MITVQNGKLTLEGKRSDLQQEYMLLIDSFKNSDLFKDYEEFKMCTLFAIMQEEDQRDCVLGILDDMIHEFEKVKKDNR